MTPSLTELMTSISWPSWLSGKEGDLDLLAEPVALQVLDQVVVVDAAVGVFRIVRQRRRAFQLQRRGFGAPDDGRREHEAGGDGRRRLMNARRLMDTVFMALFSPTSFLAPRLMLRPLYLSNCMTKRKPPRKGARKKPLRIAAVVSSRSGTVNRPGADQDARAPHFGSVALRNLQEVATGVLEHRRGHGAHIDRRLSKSDAQPCQPVMLASNILDPKGCAGNSISNERRLERLRSRMLIRLQIPAPRRQVAQGRRG